MSINNHAAIRPPLIGLGFRLPIAKWTLANLSEFDVLEITVDHYIHGGERSRDILRSLVGRIPLVAHGVGLSIGTGVPLDEWYLDQVAMTVEDLQMPSYSEHLAWTKVPDVDFANLLPLPKTKEVAEMIIEKVQIVQHHIGVPFDLENISYIFDFPDSTLSDAEFFRLICSETGAGMLLDVENLFVNSRNHDFDPIRFIDQIPSDLVRGLHTAGGPTATRDYLDRPILVDNHSHPVPDETLDLMAAAVDRFRPQTVILERDDMVNEVDQLLSDVRRMRRRISKIDHDTDSLEPIAH